MSDTGEEVEDGLGARREAGRLLEAALARRNGLEEAATSPGFRALSPRDRAFARALALATLRWLGPIDRALDGKLRSPPPDSVRSILRIGAAQLWALNTPAWAAVDTGVRLVEAGGGTKPFKGLVNAVLRGLARDGAPEAPPEASLPDWLWARWRGAFGEDGARAVASLVRSEPPTDLSVKGDAAALAEALEGRVLATGSVRTDRRGDVSTWPGYAEGGWWVQDAAAALPARLLGVQAGETALDMCAAPAARRCQLAAAGREVTAAGPLGVRLKRIAANLERVGLGREVDADATTWSGTMRAVRISGAAGTRHAPRLAPSGGIPTCMWGRPSRRRSVSGRPLQARLLDSRLRRVGPGGRLVYCTCSLEPEVGRGASGGVSWRDAGVRAGGDRAGEAGAPGEAVTRRAPCGCCRPCGGRGGPGRLLHSAAGAARVVRAAGGPVPHEGRQGDTKGTTAGPRRRGHAITAERSAFSRRRRDRISAWRSCHAARGVRPSCPSCLLRALREEPRPSTQLAPSPPRP
jgi:16S rRNA (cytosine967-C5)-methyltransferase